MGLKRVGEDWRVNNKEREGDNRRDGLREMERGKVKMCLKMQK